MTSFDFQTTLQNAIDVQLSEQQLQCLKQHQDLLNFWNHKINLTSVRSAEDQWLLHYADSLSALPFVREASHVVDVGSGAGFPGIPLAVLLPHTEVTLVEVNQKKARFLKQAVHDLSLPNVRVYSDRVETFTEKPDVIISRAFSSLAAYYAAVVHLGANRVLAMKGRFPQDEITEIQSQTTPIFLEIIRLDQMSALIGERHMVVMKRG